MPVVEQLRDEPDFQDLTSFHVRGRTIAGEKEMRMVTGMLSGIRHLQKLIVENSGLGGLDTGQACPQSNSGFPALGGGGSRFDSIRRRGFLRGRWSR